MRSLHLRIFMVSVAFVIVCSLFFTAVRYFDTFAAQPRPHLVTTTIAGNIHLDSHLPTQTLSANGNFNNFNGKFGSRFDFVIAPWAHGVWSGTDGVFHDSLASYIVGIAPSGKHMTSIFHMGNLDSSQGDTYVINEHWTQGLDTSRWEGDASDGLGMHLIVDFIDTFAGEPGCTAIIACAGAIRDDTVPTLIVGVTLQNKSARTLAGNFLFGSNRKIPSSNACVQHRTPGRSIVNLLSYDSSADATGGTLFMAGTSASWHCNTSVGNRAGFAWNYNVPATHSQTSYFLLGGWNSSQNLLVNTLLPANCQHEGLYYTHEWTSLNEMVNFAIDNLNTGHNLLGRSQSMENLLIGNGILTSTQRWTMSDTFRSYKLSSWLTKQPGCVGGGGYDATVSEGSYGFLSTVDVMHDYSYFEINRVPWFFKQELSTVFRDATSDIYGTYFQHDLGGEVNSSGYCTAPGGGVPTLRSSCYFPPYALEGAPMPVEENDNVALLTLYYVKLNHDPSLAIRNIRLIDAAMSHNLLVADPNTGIAYNFQDTGTTFDDQKDCLRNYGPGAGNNYYQGVKEAAGYRAVAYLDSLVHGDKNATKWKNAAAKIENAIVQKYHANGFIPIAATTNAFNNCNGRSIALGDGLFYLQLAGLANTMNQTLLQDLASQYRADLSADTLTSPSMVVLESTRATGPQCLNGSCARYEWFSKAILSTVVADVIYAKHGCGNCRRIDVTQAVYKYNNNFSQNFGDGFRDDGSTWGGHFYPRGIVSWAFLGAFY